MRGKLMFVGGLAVGFVLGSRAGRQAYEEMLRNAKRLRDNPTVQEAAGVVQEQANRLYTQGKDTVSGKLGNTRLGERFMGNGERGSRATGGRYGDERSNSDRVTVGSSTPPPGSMPPPSTLPPPASV
jgi:hypothetical protein